MMMLQFCLVLFYLNLDMKASMGFLTMEIQEGVEQVVENEMKWTWRSVRAGLGKLQVLFSSFIC